MRAQNIQFALGALLGLASLAAACSHYEERDRKRLIDDVNGGGGASTSTSSSTGAGGTGGSGGIPNVNCDPAKGTVAESCGVFVSFSKGGDKNAGTKASPFKSINAALAAPKVSALYVCGESFSEAVVVSAGVTIYGAMDCSKSTWDYDPKKRTSLTTAPDAIPLTLDMATGIEVRDFVIQAASAMMDGGSSIALVADAAAASLVRVDVIAGDGKAGLNGTTPGTDVGPSDPADPAVAGNKGQIACSDMALENGGLPKDNAHCPNANGGPLGGLGGSGLVANGTSGDAVVPSGQTAQGGLGQVAMGWACVVGNGKGTDGNPGNGGNPGVGATGATSFGSLTKQGYTGIGGKDGEVGLPGQGGGGGGGAKGKLNCAGASGGSGGAGGCGGFGGLGGKAGGGSFGILNLKATLSFDTVTVTLGMGGKGGDGGDGEFGGAGGNGGSGGAGNGTNAACSGGNGGNGGQGGKGGGGRGGHAVGIAYTGMTAPSTMGVTFKGKGSAGPGGTGADAAHNGDAGALGDVQGF
jgi:hypothetical protein